MSSWISLPAENRVNLQGDRICRWCSSTLQEATYIPIRKRKRQVALLCVKCDSAATTSFHHEFGI